jgi:hypothetical protein
VVAALIVTTQVPVPEQPPPLQPVKVDPAAATAVNVTRVPKLNEAEHVAPQEMPVGALVTVPVPLPDLFTVRLKDWTAKPAVTVVSALIVTTQVPVPVQPPPVQPVNVDPAAGVAVSVTGVPVANAAAQVEPQLMPAGLLETVPLPAPAFEIVSVGPIGTPVPVTSRETESPSATKLTFTLWSVVFVGVKRTVTVWVAPAVLRLKGLPDTMVNGAGTEAVPVTPARLLWTVNVCSAKLPMLTLPKAVVVVGVTVISGFAVAVATLEQELALPAESTAATETL